MAKMLRARILLISDGTFRTKLLFFLPVVKKPVSIRNGRHQGVAPTKYLA